MADPQDKKRLTLLRRLGYLAAFWALNMPGDFGQHQAFEPSVFGESTEQIPDWQTNAGQHEKHKKWPYKRRNRWGK